MLNGSSLHQGQEDPLEKSIATHSAILAWRILRTEEPGGLQSKIPQRAAHDWQTNIHFPPWDIRKLVWLYFQRLFGWHLDSCFVMLKNSQSSSEEKEFNASHTSLQLSSPQSHGHSYKVPLSIPKLPFLCKPRPQHRGKLSWILTLFLNSQMLGLRQESNLPQWEMLKERDSTHDFLVSAV